jgi:hypothetical protein
MYYSIEYSITVYNNLNKAEKAVNYLFSQVFFHQQLLPVIIALIREYIYILSALVLHSLLFMLGLVLNIKNKACC